MGDSHFSWKNPGWEQNDDYRVGNLSLDDMTEFCRWLSRKEGQSYRLPTEAEWEYACRAGTVTMYWTGDDSASLQGAANIADAALKEKLNNPNLNWAQSWNDGYPFTAPVGSFKPNPFGLYDVHGNVLEVCSDRFAPDYYVRSPLVDPQGPPLNGPSTSANGVGRGGNWWVGASLARSAYRSSALMPAAPPDAQVGSSAKGFRVVREILDKPR